jgi:catechol 2,3-dioxygenase-like lactoylglutathione lyase family enzyme
MRNISIAVSNLDRAERFYEEVFGLAILRRFHDQSGRPNVTWLRLDDESLLALESKNTRENRSPMHSGVCCVPVPMLQTDRDRWKQRLAKAACPVLLEGPSGIYTRDPDGNWIALVHEAAG